MDWKSEQAKERNVGILMASHEQGRWVFNPPDNHLVEAGASLVLMASPDGRAQVERLLHAERLPDQTAM